MRLRLLLNEMWSPEIATELRRRGHDVVAINEPDTARRYAGIPDGEVFDKAQEDNRAIVTDNVADYERARADWESRGTGHHGVVYALNPPFNRHRGTAVIGQMVRALDHFLASKEGEAPLNRSHFLRSAPDD